VSRQFWQAKIEGLCRSLGVSDGQASDSTMADRMTDRAIAIAAASDRALLHLLPNCPPATEVRHLLSGDRLELPDSSSNISTLDDRIAQWEQDHPLPATATPEQQQHHLKRKFWWLWRCLPAAVSEGNPSLLLSPATTALPDVSCWSAASLSAALAGALAGYDDDATGDRPTLAIFSFTPVQELIKASRKMRDFWAGSWVLHYLSAKICWRLAHQYGPDSLIYPSLFGQPLIDCWLRQQWNEFEPWIPQPAPRRLLTAGFPNVIFLVLPAGKVKAAMQTARQTLNQAWLQLGDLVYQELHDRRRWMGELQAESRTWNGWLRHQWQPYWSALPLGHPEADLMRTVNGSAPDLESWLQQQNRTCALDRQPADALFSDAETQLLQAVATRQEGQQQAVQVNVGSWWPYLFDQLRFCLSSVKSARVWKLPTAFGPRSTISGFGPVVYPHDPQPNQKGKFTPITETNASQYWGEAAKLALGQGNDREQTQKQAGLFDGREQLNASETLKRVLHKVLGQNGVLSLDEDAIAAAYPDLTSGVAGYLKVYREAQSDTASNRRSHFNQVCEAIIQQCPWAKTVADEMRGKWGIPWYDSEFNPKKHHPRLLNAGWLVEDLDTKELDDLREQLQHAFAQDAKHQIDPLKQQIVALKTTERIKIQAILDSAYPNNNPADWYVLAAGDGDGMSQWLKGTPLKHYEDYIPGSFQPDSSLQTAFNGFKALKKRMGPSTHNGLSRALLDFANQLVPYLTEERYAGRLIYCGGDDVLAYTNLWEWDRWLWDIRQCFRGADDPQDQFCSEGDYWRWEAGDSNPLLENRPLFTMGSKATISFGLVIAHHSVPLAIALENLWEAENKAKDHFCDRAEPEKPNKKDAVQLRVLYANGNCLKATSKFDAFQRWQRLLPDPGDEKATLTAALFEQAAQVWSQHPAPVTEAIPAWSQAFCSRREIFSNDEAAQTQFRDSLSHFLTTLWNTTPIDRQIEEIQNWLKLAAFLIRHRNIEVRPINN